MTDKGSSKDGCVPITGGTVKPPFPGGTFILVSEITRKAVVCVGDPSVGFSGVWLWKAVGILKDEVFYCAHPGGQLLIWVSGSLSTSLDIR